MNTTQHSLTRVGAITGAALAAAALVPAIAPSPAVAATTPAAAVHATAGWSAVMLGHGTTSGNGTLVLVSPTGARYTVRAGFSLGTQVEDVANDGRHVLVADYDTGDLRHRLVEVSTGRVTTFQGRWSEMRFTNPSGAAVLARTMPWTRSGGLQRLGFRDGASHLPTSVVEFRSTLGGQDMLPTPGGTAVVSTIADHRLQVNANSGALLRRIALPSGMRWCSPQHWRDAAHFTAACYGTGSVTRVYSFPVGGGRPVALTTSLPTSGSLQWGYHDSWSLSSGQVVLAESPCGPARLGRVRAGRVSLLPGAGSNATLAVTGGFAYQLTGQDCGSTGGSLVRTSMATGARTVLAGGSRMTVRSAAVVDPTA